MTFIDCPDAALLVLWDATPDDHAPKADTAADRWFDDYCDTIWPGYCTDSVNDPVAGLMHLPAITLDGFQAKAAALRALHDASAYTGQCRDDELEIMSAFLLEVAGRVAVPLGEQVQSVGAAMPAAVTEITVCASA